MPREAFSNNSVDIESNLFGINANNLLEFYNGIDLLVLPSLSESFPNVVPESMLCSTPVLSSDAGCSKIIINNYGFVMNKNSVSSIQKNLNKIIKLYIFKKSYWRDLKKKTRSQIINNFSIAKMSKQYLRKWTF